MDQTGYRSWHGLPGLLLGAILAWTAGAAPTTAPSPADQAMASRLVEVGQLILRAPQQTEWPCATIEPIRATCSRPPRP